MADGDWCCRPFFISGIHVMRVLAAIGVVLFSLGVWYFADGRWSGLHWEDYLRSHQCTAETLSDGQNIRRNLFFLQGDGETSGYSHHLSLWRCSDGQLVAIYGGLDEGRAPATLVKHYAGKYHHGLYGGDDAHRFVTAEDLTRLHSITDWEALIASRGH